MARLVTRIRVKDSTKGEHVGQFMLWQLPNGVPIAMKDGNTGEIIPWHAIECMYEGAVDVVIADPGKMPGAN